jgi:Tfp pilus assembly protein PilF
MKSRLNIFPFILLAITIAGCTTAQKTAKLEMEPMLTTIHHSDESAGGHYKLGRYLQDTQRPDQALQAYQDVLKLNPDDVKAHVAIAVLYAERGDYSISISQLKNLIEKSPDDASLYNNLGYAYYLSGDYKEAASILGRAIVIDPTNVRTLNNMGAALNKLGKTEHALKFVTLAKTIKTGKIRPADEPLTSSNSVMPIADVNQQALTTQPLATVSDVAQNQTVIENSVAVVNSQTEIRQVNSGIYEIVKTETPIKVAAIDTPMKEPLPEVKLLAQSGGVSFKVHPLVNKLFNENISVIAGNTGLSDKMFSLEIVNGNGVKNFARKTREVLAEVGLKQDSKITDKKTYNQYKTVLQYRVGYLDEAVNLGKTLNKMPVLVKLNTLPNNADLRLVLGRDVINSHYNKQAESA